MVTRTAIVDALERRYDYYSARNIFKEVLARAAVDDKDDYSEKEVVLFTDTLKSFGDRLDVVLGALTDLSGPAPAVKAEKVEAPKAEKEEAPKAAEAKAEAEAEVKADAKEEAPPAKEEAAKAAPAKAKKKGKKKK